jgi:hypothetical protein
VVPSDPFPEVQDLLKNSKTCKIYLKLNVNIKINIVEHSNKALFHDL